MPFLVPSMSAATHDPQVDAGTVSLQDHEANALFCFLRQLPSLGYPVIMVENQLRLLILSI